MKIFKNITVVALFLSVISNPFGLIAQQKSDTEKLSPKQQTLISISAYTAKGNLKNLKMALNSGLDAGLTVNETKEALVHLYAYCGFPRSIRGLQTFIDVIEEREARGIKDEWGAEASPIEDERSKYERGKETLEELTGASQDGPKKGYAVFSPEIEVFLKEHLFADIFERDVLTYAQRELVTISVLSALGNLEPMLRGHFNICLNVGLAQEQLLHFVKIIGSTIGEKEAMAAKSLLDEVLKSRN